MSDDERHVAGIALNDQIDAVERLRERLRQPGGGQPSRSAVVRRLVALSAGLATEMDDRDLRGLSTTELRDLGRDMAREYYREGDS